jgi:hypothetical protein
LLTGKIIPQQDTQLRLERLRNGWNGSGFTRLESAKQSWRNTMYIGLGGILILILILWLLGVI